MFPWFRKLAADCACVTLPAIDFHPVPLAGWPQGVIISGVYTYGSPRVGDPRFRDLYGSSGLDGVTYRYVHRNDVIPQVRAASVVRCPSMAQSASATTVLGDVPQRTPQTMSNLSPCASSPANSDLLPPCVTSCCNHIRPGLPETMGSVHVS